MAIFKMTSGEIAPVMPSTFSQLQISERGDLQRLLRDKIEIISPDTLVVSEEFGEWDDSRRRIDLLGLDKDANLVVIELKRTEDGGHMELQALRYASMVSTLTFDRLTQIYERYLEQRGKDVDARKALLDFLDWEEPNESEFANDVRIVLASAEFSKELTTTVLWLCDRDIDIRCVRIKPYGEAGNILIDVQQVIPLPEALDYQVRVREKKQADRATKTSTRDFTRFNLTLGDRVLVNQYKRRAMLEIVKELVSQGIDPTRIGEVLTWKKNLFFSANGDCSSEEMTIEFAKHNGVNGDRSRWFHTDDQLIHCQGKTFALTNQWGDRTEEAIHKLLETFRPVGISIEKAQ